MTNKPTDVFLHVDIKAKDECWLWTGALAKNGRPYIRIDGRSVLAYYVTYELVLGEPFPKGKVGRHTCDNPKCCNPYHLIPGTQQENMDDMKERERHGLPHHTVKAIKRLLVDGIPHTVIAKRFGVSRELVTHINSGRVYCDVTIEEK